MEFYTTEPQAEYAVTSAQAVPHSREAEEAVVGSVLINPDVFHECRINIQSADEFYITRHKWIWQAYEDLFTRKVPVDLLTVGNELENMGKLTEIGGPAFLTSLINQVPTTINAHAYAAIVHGHYVRRQMIQAANEIATFAYNEQIAIDEGISKSTRALSQAVGTANTPHTHNIKDSVMRVDAKIEARGKLNILPGIPTGLIDLDRLLGGGAQDGELLVIAGRPGDGKTSLVLQIMLYAGRYVVNQKIIKKRIVIFSLEMSEEQLVIRMLSQMTGIDSQDLRSGKIPELKIAEFINALDELAAMDIVIDDTPGVSPAYIRSRCEILNSESKLDLVIVDYLDLVKSGRSYQKEYSEINDNTTELKNMARELNIPVYVARQMNRGIEYRGVNGRPQKSDLRDGGEQDPDVIAFIYHEKDDKGRIISSEIIVDKQRNGPPGDVPVVFRGALTKFENAFRVRSGD